MSLSDDARAAIAASPMFCRLKEPDLALLEKCGAERAYGKDETLFAHGDPCRGFYLVVDGMVKVYRVGTDGRETVLHLVGPPDHFAEAALFEDLEYPASAICTEASVLIFFERDRFLHLIAEHSSFALGLFAGLSLWIRRMVGRVEGLTVTDAPQRLARMLVDLKLQGRGGERFVELPARKYLIAGQLGMTAPTFSRCLAKLETDGVVRVEGRKLFVLDPDRLEELAGV